ncbi:ty3-gypsy retrotransposon protein [Cucumis melo var. makuwa]|uniref:Ty3-gypsy retrotransposon protein n=1 Tax=Cucumis melo var. makuwa TaxID=1194695 RepID=A0A5A7UFR0_CUCMM|nr:ty3-gypsy retrotransposon protein [Cucumis melo var. makuwa]
MLWVSSPWVSVIKKKGRGDEKNGAKVGVFVMRRSSFVREGILKKETGVCIQSFCWKRLLDWNCHPKSLKEKHARTRTRFCVFKKKSWEQPIESPKGGIIIRENPLFNNSTPASNLSDKESHFEVVSVMMADVTSEAAMAEIKRKINFLMKLVEERDHEISALKDQMKACETTKSSKTPSIKVDDKGKLCCRKTRRNSPCLLPPYQFNSCKI